MSYLFPNLVWEPPTDWVKSELLETVFAASIASSAGSRPTDWVKSELLETLSIKAR